jgi:hypothetical protein
MRFESGYMIDENFRIWAQGKRSDVPAFARWKLLLQRRSRMPVWRELEQRNASKSIQMKKEEFPGHTQSMPPENSFPQIWVVSEICVDSQNSKRLIDDIVGSCHRTARN